MRAIIKVIDVAFVFVLTVTVLRAQNASIPNSSSPTSTAPSLQTNAQPPSGLSSKVVCAIKLPDPRNATEWQQLAQSRSNREKNNSDQNPDERLNGRLYLVFSMTEGHLHTVENKVACPRFPPPCSGYWASAAYLGFKFPEQKTP
jgi:hypothetical protein